MKPTKAMRMNAEDSFTFMISIGFLTTPLLLLVLAGAMQAMTAA